MSEQREFSLLTATRHIGWGGVGKLRLILEKLPCAEVVLHGDEQSAAITKEFLGSHHKFSAHRDRRPDAALVINDPVAANNIADLDVPVVYVDSLPYVHRTDTDVPTLTKIAHYCAQKYPIELLPLTSPLLQNWHDISWIDPIVPIPRSRRGGGGIVINVGGLYTFNVGGVQSDLADKAVDAYLNLVLFPLVTLLHTSGRKISAVCGNLSDEACRRLREILPKCDAIGPQSPHAFEHTLTDADLLITSPGSTTILQATAIGLPTLLLPSQNRSQFFNAQLYSKADADIMRWPASVLDAKKLEQMRSQGISAVLGYIFNSIIDAATSQEVATEVTTIIRNAINNAPVDGVLNPYLSVLGIAGADQVAQLVKQTALRHQEYC
jgi:hydroxymethylcytosylglucuronate/cytosylglucuronate synthase